MSDIHSLTGFVCTACSRLVIFTLCVSVAGCAEIVINTDWPKVLLETGNDFARSHCQADRNKSYTEYEECRKEANKTYENLEMQRKTIDMQRQAAMQEALNKKDRCKGAKKTGVVIRLDDQSVTQSHDGPCQATQEDMIDFNLQ